MSAQRTRVAVVGVGHFGRNHARIYSSMPDVELVAVVDSHEERCRAIGDQYGARASPAIPRWARWTP